MSELIIRPVELNDAAAIQAIYAPYVTDTTVTFETEVPDISEIRRRIEHTTSHYPYIVAQLDHQVIGYAYANRFRARKAYDKSAEMSLYLDQNIRGNGYGKALLTGIELALRDRGIITMVSVIEASNAGSLKFHEKNGFIRAGYLARIGYKFDKWLDIHLLTKQIPQ